MDFNFLGMNFSHYVVWFFTYAFFGWCMECVVIRRQLGIWENRGFAKAPFCIIYGFGTTIALMMFQPISHNLFALYLWGAVMATGLEFLTAKIMLKLFGEIWWDYSHLKFNYKGIICLESTLGWGCLCIFIVGFFNDILIRFVSNIDNTVTNIIASVLFVEYIVDFGYHFYVSLVNKPELKEECEYKEN